jgi:hypothetical protein
VGMSITHHAVDGGAARAPGAYPAGSAP